MSDFLTTRSQRVQEIVREQQLRRFRESTSDRNETWANLRRVGVGRIPVMVPDRNLDAGKTINQVLPDGSWAGERCFIIGGGPSLRNFAFSRLDGELVIGVNRAYEKIDCTVMYSMDDQFFNWASKGAFGPDALARYERFAGFRVWGHFNGQVPPGFYGVHLTSDQGLPHSIGSGLGNGNNSGYSALMLAYCLGANPIYLLGFDMVLEGARTHWHDGYPHSSRDHLEDFRKSFNGIAPEIARAGTKVINLCQNSALQCFEKGRLEDLSRNNMPTFVSYYTTGNGYEAEADHLDKSLRRWNLRHDIRAIADLGNWQANTHYKAAFLAEMMDSYAGQPIMWLDADSVVAQYPKLMRRIEADAAVHFRGQELLSGTIFLAPTEASRRLIELWRAENADNPARWDQENLGAVIKQWDGKLERLPAEYCRIYDDMKADGPAVIIQYQASRRLKYAAQWHGVPSLVSIVMPTYNQAKYLRSAVDSILAQTYRDFELIIVDDGSMDSTQEILKGIADIRVKVIRKENGGTGSALNAGFALAHGEFETWFSSDNILYPQALERLVSTLRARPEMSFAYGDADIGLMDESGLNEVERSLLSKEVDGQAHDPGKTLNYYYFGIAWVWRRGLRLKTGGEFQRGPCEDYDMVLRMEEAGGRFTLVPEPLAWFRRHRENLTARTPHATVKAIRDKAIERRASGSWHLEKIPKVMNVYWGSSTMPWLRFLTLETFIRHNPEWEVRLWRPSIFDETPGAWKTLEHRVSIKARNYWPEAERLPLRIMISDRWPGIHEVLRSDRLRWEILAHDGGGWSDMDILYTRPLAALDVNAAVNTGLDFTVSIGDFLHSIGFILAAPGNPFYAKVAADAERQSGNDLYQGYGALLLNRAYKTIDAIRQAFVGVNMANIPMEAFYSYSTHAATETLYGTRSGMRRTGPGTVGVHWYAGHPKAGDAVNFLTHENWSDADMLICEHIAEALNG